MVSTQIGLGVGDIVVSLEISDGIRLAGYAASYVVDAPAEVTIDFFLCDAPRVPPESASFVGGIWGWNAYLLPDGKSLLIVSVRSGVQVLLDLEPLSARACAFVPRVGGTAGEGERLAREIAVVEVLPLPAVWALSEREGMLLHTCGVAHEGDGLLFVGVSGSGKSTLARLWDSRHHPRSYVINDEHAILSCRNGACQLYGAPWVRGGIEARYARVPLRAVFFLSHGECNRILPLSPIDALTRLLSQVFLPVWDQRQLGLVMATCSDLMGRIPAYQLEFVPEPGTVGFVQEFVESLL